MLAFVTPETTFDEALVARSLAGDRDAFGAIVARYQSLVCSIAYSATGSLSRSEDLAQETFIEAWRKLAALREPGSLRAWLCGIARNLVNDALRRDGREPARGAEPIEAIDATPASEPAPVERAISDEEQAILWRAIGRIPVTYREPLVLFYREQQSVEAVAIALGLTEEAAKQRLSRGRRLLQEQVQAFVEGALGRTAPGVAFTAGVVAALPLASPSAAAATVAIGATQSGALAKTAGLAAFAAALIGPVVAFAGSYFSVRAGLDASRTERERATLLRDTRAIGVGSVLYTIVAFAVLVLAPRFLAWAEWYAAFAALVPLVFFAWLGARIVRSICARRRIREQERARAPELFARVAEYRSRWTLLGLPLVHVRYDVPAVDAAPARGWIAVGDRADGVLFALGGVARGGVAVGGISVGLLAVGAITIAPLSLGGLALGALAFGGAAFAWNAIGGFAFGWRGAAGALAVAHDYAGGGLAIGAHANDAAVRAYFAQALPEPVIPMLFFALIALSVFPAALLAWRTRVNLRR